MNNIMKFENKKVEIFEWNRQVLFNPYHVGECLNLTESSVRNYLANMNSKQAILLKNLDVLNMDIRKLNNAGEKFLTESGVYKLMFKSHKPDAERFKNWVTDEVLPSIREIGEYKANNNNSLQVIKLVNKQVGMIVGNIQKLGDRVVNLENNMTIDYAQQEELNSLARKVVVQALGGKDAPAYKELNKKAFSTLWRDYKRVMQVNSYKNTATKELERGKKLLSGWKPNRELELMIKGANSQMNF